MMMIKSKYDKGVRALTRKVTSVIMQEVFIK